MTTGTTQGTTAQATPRDTTTMHAAQVPLAPADARRLIGRALEQAGRPSDAEVLALPGAGTTSYVLRVGTDLVARFPMTGEDPDAVRAALVAEHAAMAEFAAACPVPAPLPVAIGEGDDGFPLPFSLQTWVEGEVATPTSVAGSVPVAEQLADLLGTLREVPTRGRRFAGGGRGGELPDQDAWMRTCLENSRGLLPVEELAALWDRWRTLPHESADVMSHTDLIPGNLLLGGGRVVGVLDAGGFGPADPALDLVAAWHLLDGPAREVLRRRLEVPELDWLRGAAWAFAQAMGLVWYYRETNPPMAELGRTTLSRLLASADDLDGPRP